MNCTTCRYQLSQCLDGRLPSGRRTVVMQHAASCSTCNEFWTDLQAAQQLTLRLGQTGVGDTGVGDTFREGLWERIQAGEGTPEAVFREPVPMWSKIRYTLTGAAAAAAALLLVTYLQEDQQSKSAPQPDATFVAQTPDVPNGGNLRDRNPERIELHGNPLIPSTQRLTFNLVALESARQLEQRRATVLTAIRLINSPDSNQEAAIAQAIESAEEFRAFGELLLDMRDRKRLIFTDTLVDSDLRVAVNMLGYDQLSDRSQRGDLRTVQTIVAPALRSDRLANLSRTISLVPSSDPRAEIDALMRFNAQRPEVFTMLFFVVGSDEEAHRELHLMRPGMFFMKDACGPSYVAPRSQVEARDGLMRMRGRIKVHVQRR